MTGDKPYRVQRRRARGWKMPPNTVYVGRPTVWGNPFNGPYAVRDYTDWLNGRMEIVDWQASPRDITRSYQDRLEVLARVKELHGKNLACWCRHEDACHADVLLAMANATKGE